LEPTEVRELWEYLASIYGDYLQEAYFKALHSKNPLRTFIRLLSSRHKMDIFTLRVAVAYFEYMYRGTMRAMIFE
jgi:hypothetical protein